jgi:hypothetical protein
MRKNRRFNRRPAATTTAVALAMSLASMPAAWAEPAQPYVMTQEELAYDCKKLTGRMQVRILDLRDYAVRSKSTLFSRGMQFAVTAILGGTDFGRTPDAQYARDVARLHAYNRLLVAKDCKSFDLAAELQPKPVKETPEPAVAAPSKSKPGKKP